MSLEWSKGRRRPSTRTPSGDRPALPPADTADAPPMHDKATGRFLPGNRAHRLRQVKERAKGISTLDPAKCPSWLSPYVREGVRVAADFVTRFPDDPAIAPLLGSTVDAWVVFRALLALGAAGDGQALTEARGWLREHRACIATLAALAGDLKRERDASNDPHAALAAIAVEGVTK